MTDHFEQGVKFIFATERADVPPLGTEEFADFAAGMQFAARVQLVLDQMKPERQTPPDTPKGPHGWMVTRYGNSGTVLLYAGDPADEAKVKVFIPDPEYKVIPFTMGGELTA